MNIAGDADISSFSAGGGGLEERGKTEGGAGGRAQVPEMRTQMGRGLVGKCAVMRRVVCVCGGEEDSVAQAY